MSWQRVPDRSNILGICSFIWKAHWQLFLNSVHHLSEPLRCLLDDGQDATNVETSCKSQSKPNMHLNKKCPTRVSGTAENLKICICAYFIERINMKPEFILRQISDGAKETFPLNSLKREGGTYTLWRSVEWLLPF